VHSAASQKPNRAILKQGLAQKSEPFSVFVRPNSLPFDCQAGIYYDIIFGIAIPPLIHFGETQGRWPVPKLFISELKPNLEIASLFVASEKQLRTARNGTVYLDLKLLDKTGDISGKMWEKAAESSAGFKSGDIVYLRARTELYKDRIQLSISEIMPVPAGAYDPADFLPVCPYDRDALFERLGKLLSGMADCSARRLCEAILADPDIMTRFKLAPAAKSMHHAYIGGLLEHTLSVITLVYRICNHYPDLDRDLLIAGAFLHDIGKIDEFVYDTHIDYSDAGRLVGHMVMGIQIVEDKIRTIEGFPAETSILLKHLILSHHGEAQFGAVRLPASREAFALHLADDLDAKMNAISRILANSGEDDSTWTGFETIFGRHFFKGFPKQNDSAAGEKIPQTGATADPASTPGN
jgi:3'-5' exoribonuclease